MLKLNKKGQASSTFQLLIAAVVALAILGVLLNILGVLPGLNKDPSSSTKTLLGTQVNNPGAESCTEAVTFTRSKSTLSAEGITINSGLDIDQVFFANPQKISTFTANTALLRYNSNSSKKVMMCIICSSDKENLKAAIDANKREDDGGFEPEDDSGIITSLPSNQTVCVVYPRNTSSS